MNYLVMLYDPKGDTYSPFTLWASNEGEAYTIAENLAEQLSCRPGQPSNWQVHLVEYIDND